MRVATRSQIRSIEKHTFNEYGMPSIVLMERAGQAVADMILDMADEDGENGLRPHFVVLCGTGGNGGDGFVAARDLLFAGYPVTVFAIPVKGRRNDDAETERAFLERVAPEGTILELAEEETLDKLEELLDEDAVVIDALFGIGLDRAITGMAVDVIAIVNASPAHAVVSADIPSGIDCDTGAALGTPVFASDTVTFGLPKLGLYMGAGAEAAGEIHVDQLIYPDILLEQSSIHAQLTGQPEFPKRMRTMHKATYGKAAIIAGSPDYTGAPVFAAQAALATGSGTVHLITPDGIADVVRAKVDGPIVQSFPGDVLTVEAVPRVLELLEGETAALVGPGLGRDPRTMEAVLLLATAFRGTLILDGDALFACVGHLDVLWKRGNPTILTPHAGEFARFVGLTPEDVEKGGTLSPAQTLAAEASSIVHLKGHRSLTVLPDGSVFINPTGNPGMAKPGMGDALGGIILSLVARGTAPDAAVAQGAYIHGLAGDAAAEVMGEESMSTADVIMALAATIKELNAG
jgi:NAD(P)H-hydrate epimerase